MFVTSNSPPPVPSLAILPIVSFLASEVCAEPVTLENSPAITTDTTFSEDTQVVFSTGPYRVVDADNKTFIVTSPNASSLTLEAFSRNDGQILSARNSGSFSLSDFNNVTITTNNSVLVANNGTIGFVISGQLNLSSTAQNNSYVINIQNGGKITTQTESISISGVGGINNTASSISLNAINSLNINSSGGTTTGVRNNNGIVELVSGGSLTIKANGYAVSSDKGQVCLLAKGDEGITLIGDNGDVVSAKNTALIELGNPNEELKKLTVTSTNDANAVYGLYATNQGTVRVTSQSTSISTSNRGVYASNGTVVFDRSSSPQQTVTITSKSNRGIDSNNSGKVQILTDVLTLNSSGTGITAANSSEIVLGSAQDYISKLSISPGNGYGIGSSGSSEIIVASANTEIISHEQQKTDAGSQPYSGNGIFASDNGIVRLLNTDDKNQRLYIDSRWGAMFASGGQIDVASGSADLIGSVLATKGGSVVLGSEQSLSDLSVRVEDGNTGADEAAVNARTGSIIINAKKAEISSSKTAIMATGQNTEPADSSVSINVSDSLTINGDITANVHRDGSSELGGNRFISINDTTEGDVVINGNILTESDGSNTSSAVVLNLKTENSVLNGAVLDTDRSSSFSESTGGTELNLSSGSAWNVSGDSVIKTVNSENGRINTDASSITIDSLNNSGSGTTITANAVEEGLIHINRNHGDGLTVVLQSEATDTLPGDSVGNEKVMNSLVYIGETDSSYVITANEGSVIGTSTLTKNPDGSVSYSQQVNTVTQGLEDISAMNYLMFRSQMNDLQKRMGDLRIMPKESGAWARYYGGQNKYGASGLKNKYHTLQLGADYRITDNFILGGTFSYTDDNGTLKNGSSDGKQYSFGLYGGWLGENGQYADVIVKRHRIKTEYDLTNLSGIYNSASYYNWGTTISAEYGWRFECSSTGFYVEPQAEFSIGHLDGVKYSTSRGVSVHQKTIKSVVGRIGTAVGYIFPNNKGSVYAKASVLHDWDGKAEGTLTFKSQKTSYRDDLGGTWGEFAVGGTYNAGRNLTAYGEVQTTAGSPIRNPWQLSVGLRYSF